MTERKKTGAELLDEVKSEKVEARRDKVKDMMGEVVSLIEQRRGWIKSREKQIEKLETIQADLVKAYDADDLDERDFAKIRWILRAMNASPRERMEMKFTERNCDHSED